MKVHTVTAVFNIKTDETKAKARELIREELESFLGIPVNVAMSPQQDDKLDRISYLEIKSAVGTE